MALKDRPARVSNYTNEDVRDGIIRCLTDPLFEDAPLEEIAAACETTLWVVKKTIDDLKLRKCLAHARIVSEQLGLGMDSYPTSVITMALEKLASEGKP